MTRMSMPSSFHVNLFALMPVRCSSSNCEAVMAETGADFGLHPFCMRAVTSAWESASRFSVEFWVPSFPNRPLGESASQNTGLRWDALSQTGLNRKLRPSLRPQNGMNFPPDQPSLPFRRSTTSILGFVHRKYMNRCSMHVYLPACFLSKNFATPKTQSRQGFSCPTVGT